MSLTIACCVLRRRFATQYAIRNEFFMSTATIQTQLTPPTIPTQAQVRYQLDVSFQCSITPFVARQNANVYLLMNVGNMLSAGDALLSLSEQPCWLLPIFCAFPDLNHREKIGDLAVDINSGAILLEQSNPTSPQAIENHVEQIYHNLTTSSART